MIRKCIARVGRSIDWRWKDAVVRVRVSRVAQSDEFLDFWRNHGGEWAGEEAHGPDLDRISEVLKANANLSDRAMGAALAAHFRAVWDRGFANPDEAWLWDGMPDGLPDSALLAFARGAVKARRMNEAVDHK